LACLPPSPCTPPPYTGALAFHVLSRAGRAIEVFVTRLENITKQNGHQLLFIEASAAVQAGEKFGHVGPNGAGKTTLFGIV
jgi:ABC-type molybdenum transport system ATPase subunit/photorepair protein PhrA